MRSLVVISSYPPRGTTHHKSVIGGASYTKTVLTQLAKGITTRGETPHITVLAQKIEGEEEFYEENQIAVKRIWKRNSFSTFRKLSTEIRTNYKDTEKILIELELNIFGNSGIHLMLFIPFLLGLKRMGKKVIIVMHEVIIDLDEMSGHINLKTGTLKSAFMNFSLRNFYKSLFLADMIIVFENVLKTRLNSLKKTDKVKVVPIAVEKFTTNLTKTEARKNLKIPEKSFVVMSFGFLAWYKGTDWLAEIWPEKNKMENLMLILAGGENPNRVDLPYYQKYMSDLKKICKEKNITLTGFIPEEKMPEYFVASDLLVFPYRAQMSSSATIAQAFSFGKPLLVSNNMQSIFETDDMKKELEKSGLSKDNILFGLDNTFFEKIEELKNDHSTLEKLSIFSKQMRDTRSLESIVKLYYETIF